MSSYGHPQPYGHGDYGDAYDSYDGYADSYAADSYGADPPPTSPTRSTADAYAGSARGARAVAAGAAPAGRARVPSAPESPSHRYDWSGAGRQRPAAGRATVPVSPGTGPADPGGAAAGRARVRPGGPAGPSRPGGPGGSGPPAGRPQRKKKRHWVRNTMLSLLATSVIIAGGGMVALSYYVDSVPPPGDLPLDEGSTVLYSDGGEMAALQEVNREVIDTTGPELENARLAVVAAEDKGFSEHSGVDFMGIVRAAWNNLSGGEQQGASTIDQQYAGLAAGTRGEAGYGRKLQEAAMAYKMNQDLSKAEILDFYLNTIYFGRGAYGIQAAAEAYFDKAADELTLEEAAVLGGIIRYPDDGSNLSPYDPLHTPEDTTAAELRFQYVTGQLVEMGQLDPATRDAMVLPEVIEPPEANEPQKGPQGAIVRQVKYELEEMGITDLTTGGYRITTTIDPELQRAAKDAARRKPSGSAPYWERMPENISAAMVAINPENGAVLAYYGGDKGGIGYDLAGPNLNEETDQWYGGRPLGSTGKIYTLVAEMREEVRFDSHWQVRDYQPDWADERIVNAGRDVSAISCDPDFCTLESSTIQSLNVPFAHFSERVPDGRGPATIVQAMMDAGVTMMQDDDGVYHDLTAIEDASEVAPEHFFHPVAYGQYAVTVLDHANGVATLAASGVYHEAHFVAKVEEKVNGEWVPIEGDRIAGEQRIEQAYADAITGVLSQIPSNGILNHPLEGGRPAAAKTGTWEYRDENNQTDGSNQDAWVVGYTPQIATAVWVGDGTEDPGPIKDGDGGNIGSSGLPADIWKQFMDDAHAVKQWDPLPFPQAPRPGDPNSPIPNGVEPEPDNPFCRGALRNTPICQNQDQGDDGGNDGGDDGDGDDGDGDDNDGGGLIIPGTDPIIPPPGEGGGG
jgi:membrane peptidoglycan carboxypeptidase